MKNVTIVGHAFDCLPGHKFLAESGSGSSLRVACAVALRKLLSRQELRRKHVGSFKLAVTVNADPKEEKS